MAKILVTGGAGFIGSHLVDRLIELKHEVTVIDNLSTGLKEQVNDKARLIVKDIREDLNEIFKEYYDYVFHLAAQINLRTSLENPVYDAEINILGSLNIINELIKNKIKKIIFISTAAVYGKNYNLPLNEESYLDHNTPYGVGKLTIENYLEMFKKIKEINYCIIRSTNCYGPRQRKDDKGEGGVISIFINNSLEDKNLTIFGDGEQTRDFIYVSDLVNGLIKGMELDGTFTIGTEREITINKLAKMIKNLSNSNSKILYDDEIKGEVKRNSLSSKKLEKYGFRINYTLEQGLKETINYFKKTQ